MSFVMPSEIPMDSLPKPLNSNINIYQSKPVYAASITFGGFANEKVIKQMEEKLNTILAEKGIKHTSNFEILGYNPPYQVINRRNEIIVELIDFTK
jgi:hypothetical protein